MVDGFTEDEARDYLDDALSRSSELADDVAGVATDLEGLPLALSHAAAFMKNRQVPCSEYRRRFARRKSLADVMPAEQDSLPDDYRSTVNACVALAIEAANSLAPTGVAELVLRVASVLNGNDIPVDIFFEENIVTWVCVERGRHPATRALDANRSAPRPVDVGGGYQDKAEVVADGLHCLRLLNLLNLNSGVVRVHGIVQTVVRDRSYAQVNEVAAEAADALEALWSHFVLDIDSADRMLADFSTVRLFLDPEEPPHPIRMRVINAYGMRGDIARAIIEAEQLVADQGRILGADDPAALVTRFLLLGWRAKLAGPVAVVSAFTELLRDQIRVLGDMSSDVLLTRRTIAHLRGEAGDGAGALTELLQLLEDEEAAFGVDALESLETRAGIASWRVKPANLSGRSRTTRMCWRNRFESSVRIMPASSTPERRLFT